MCYRETGERDSGEGHLSSVPFPVSFASVIEVVLVSRFCWQHQSPPPRGPSEVSVVAATRGSAAHGLCSELQGNPSCAQCSSGLGSSGGAASSWRYSLWLTSISTSCAFTCHHSCHDIGVGFPALNPLYLKYLREVLFSELASD